MVINDESTSQTDTTIVEDSVLSWNFFIDISNKWDVDRSKSTLISGFFGPFHVAEMWIDGAADDFTVDLSESLGFFGEIDNLCGADKGKIERIEEEE